MSPGTYFDQDLRLSNDGDLVATSDGDLGVATIDETTQQEAILRLFTELGDFMALPSVGSRVGSFRGEQNTRTNAQLLKAEIYRCLCQNGPFASDDVSISVFPIAVDKLMATIQIRNILSLSDHTISLTFDYAGGGLEIA